MSDAIPGMLPPEIQAQLLRILSGCDAEAPLALDDTSPETVEALFRSGIGAVACPDGTVLRRRDVMNTVTAAEMKETERRADAAGLSYTQMMENAGEAAYRILRQVFPAAGSMLIVCGKGNNGGDGYVIARLAARDGLAVSVLQPEGEPVTADARLNRERLPESVRILTAADPLPEAALLVDALYGTGFHGALRPGAAAVCRMMNAAPMPVAAIDIPSGCAADTGESDPDAVRASITIAFDSWKRAHLLPDTPCGHRLLADIGIPADCRPRSPFAL